MTPAASRILAWKNDPVRFVRENFQVDPDSWQVDALLSLVKPDENGVTRLCMKACAGPGKSAVLAWIGWWFLSCWGDVGDHPKGIATSVTGKNLEDNLWAELSKWQQRSAYLSGAFTHQAESIFANDHPTTWFLSARSFPKTADAQEQGRVLSGLHSGFVFALIDESGDINPSVGRAAEQAMGNCRRGMIAQAGNPTSLDGLLYESAVTERGKWHVIEITADPDDAKRTPRVSASWAREQIAKYGRDNPWVMAYVLGKFPPSSINTLLGVEDVAAALGRHIRPDRYSFAPKVVGCDVARFGDDRTTVWRRQGLAAFDPDIMRNARTEDIAGRIAMRANMPATGEMGAWAADGIMVDGTGGYGAGVVDALRLAKWEPIEVQFAGQASDPRFGNKRAEIWWNMAQWVRDGGCLPNLPELVRELTAPTYCMKNGRLYLEDKDQIKKRLGFSPDLGDGLAITFAVEIAPKSLSVRSGVAQVAITANRSNYDPLRKRR